MDTKRNLTNSLITVFSIFFIALTAILYLSRAKISGHFYGNTDFFSFYESMRFYFSGQNLYSPVILESLHPHMPMIKSGDLNPPFLTLLFLPLYFFNYHDALFIWTFISLIALYTGIGVILKSFPQYRQYHFPIMAGFGIYIWNSVTISYGQVSNVLLLLVAFSWLYAREKKDVLAGIFMGMACALKIFCGLFLIYFFCLHRFRLLFSTVMTGLIIFITTVLLFGINAYIAYCKTLLNICWYGESWSVSFKSFFMRLFSATENNHVIFNSPFLCHGLIALSTLILWTGLIYTWHELKKNNISIRDNSSEKFDIGFSLTIMAMLLLSPLGWSYYFNLLIIPYLILVSQYRDDSIHLFCAGLLLFSTLSGELIKTFDIKNNVQILYNGGVGFYILMILLVLNFRLAYQKTRFASFEKKPAVFVPNYLWPVIYIIALMPSMASQISIINNISKISQSFI